MNNYRPTNGTIQKKWITRTFNLPSVNHMEIEYFNTPTMNKEIELVIKNVPTKTSLGPDSFMDKFYQIFKEDLTTMKAFNKFEIEETYFNVIKDLYDKLTAKVLFISL